MILEMKYEVLGVRISAVNINQTISLIDDLISSGKKGYITVTGVHGIMESQRNKEVLEAHNRSFLTVPDGMPLVWLGRWFGFKNVSRCYGPDLMLALMERSLKKDYRHFFYGGKPGIVQLLRTKMKEKYPGLKIAGVFTPPFRPLNPKEEENLIEKVERVKPHIFWVGLSTPKQELFMFHYLNELNVSLMIGVGAAFDFHAGQVKQAPKWIQRSGFEWLFRLLMDPKRLWKRYLRNNPEFLYLLFRESLIEKRQRGWRK